MSEFLRNSNTPDEGAMDFDEAVRLPGGGSTCDIFKTRWQRRLVFVKRLKPQFRANPLYLDAFDKEFEIGASLSHPSLPQYREFHRDYLVIDFIDGLTLEEMIRRNDEFLRDERNILLMFRELVDVVGYLHRHRVVHCDIKADNIMITCDTRHLILIDFDKCYTDSLPETPGDPSRYGLKAADSGRTAMDFHGIGMLAERLHRDVPGFRFSHYRRFVKACFSENASCSELMRILDYTPGRKRRRWIAGGSAAAVLLAVTAFFLFKPEKPATEVQQPVAVAGDTAMPQDSTAAPQTATQEVTTDREPTPQIAESVTEPTAPQPVTQEQLHDEAKEKAAYLDKRISPYFNELQSGLDRLKKLRDDPSLTGRQMLDAIRAHAAKEEEYIAEAFEILNENYPGMTDREKWRVMAYSKAYTGYKRRASTEQAQYRQEYERRLKAEGKTPQ